MEFNDKIYFKQRDGSDYTKYTKEEIYNMIDARKPNTFIHILQELDIPYLEDQWGLTLSHQAENGQKLNYTMGKYLSKMKLCSFKNLTFKDSIYHKDLDEFRFDWYGIHKNEKGLYEYTFYNKIYKYEKIIQFLLDLLEGEHYGVVDRYVINELKERFNYELE